MFDITSEISSSRLSSWLLAKPHDKKYDYKKAVVTTAVPKVIEEYTSKHADRRCKNGSMSSSTHPLHTRTYKRTFNGPFGTTRVSRYQKGKTNLDFTEARDSEWQWHQLGHMQVCTSLQTDNHAITPPLSFYRPDALPAAQPTASKH